MTWHFGQSHGCNSIFQVFDGPISGSQSRDKNLSEFLKELGSSIPSNWIFVAPVLCPSGELLITKITKNDLVEELSVSTECIFPSEGATAYETIMAPLDSILLRMHGQLHHTQPGVSSESIDEEAVKRQWWDQRGQLDDEMESLLEEVEERYFSNVFEEDSSLPRGNLASRTRGRAVSRFAEAIRNRDAGVDAGTWRCQTQCRR